MKNLNTRMMANYKRGFGPTHIVMLLTTIGRKSGLPRQTPLQYEELDGNYYIASARGSEADWFKNIVADPKVHVQIRDQEFDAIGEPVSDPIRIADFIELRLKRHPVIIRLIMHLFDGLPLRFSRADLEDFCKEKAMVILHPNFQCPAKTKTMNKLRFFLITFGTANAGLILYGLLAMLSPDILVEAFSSSVYQFPADAAKALAYLSALFRLLGFLNLVLGIVGLILLWRFQLNRERWLMVSVIVVSLLSYLGPIIFDNTVGSIGVFEFIEHILFAGMILSAFTMIANKQHEHD